MLEQFLRRRCALRRMRANRLAEWLDDFAAYLGRRGHSINTIHLYLNAAEHFGRWLGGKKLPLQNVCETTVKQFLEHLPTCRCPLPAPRRLILVRAALRHLLRSARESRKLPMRKPMALSPVDQAVAEFHEHLVKTCGAAQNTRIYRVRYVREFLKRKFGNRRIKVASLKASDLMSFVAEKAKGYTPGSTKVVTTSLRSYLKFIQLRGIGDARLAGALPRIPQWKLSQIPKTIVDNDLKKFLASFDRSTALGCRDYAIALCLSDLGLRASEVALLRCGDVNWREGKLLIAGSKNRRGAELPLPMRVGRALVDYVRKGRPESQERQLFVRHRAPIGVAIGPNIVRGSMKRAYERLGLKSPWRGPHVFRNTMASRMVQRGAKLKEVADILRHSTIDTTAIYAKVNLPMLSAVALPWPGAEVRS